MMKFLALSLLLLTSAFAQEFNSSQMQSIQENLIKNGGFESGRSSHTLSNGTFTTEGTVVIKGSKSLKAVVSAQTPSVVQDSTLYAAQLADGVQGMVYARVKSTVALSLCARKAGVTSTVDCVDINSDNKWALYKVPTVLGATSNGYSISSSGSVTGTFYVDDVFVGAASIDSMSGACRDSSCATSLSAAISSADVTSNESVEWINGDCTNATTGKSTCNFNAGVFTVAPNCVCEVTNGGTGDNTCHIDSVSSSSVVLTGSNNNVNTNFNLSLICQKQGEDFVAAEKVANGGFFASQCGANCADSFNAFVTDGAGTTTVSNENLDWISANCTNPGTGSYVCTFNSVFTVAPNCFVSTSGASRGINVTATAASVSVTIRDDAGTLADTNFQISCDKQGVDYVATRTIVGSFKEVDVSPGISNPKSCKVQFGGASDTSSCTSSPCTEYFDSCGAVSSITRGATGTYNITFADGTWGALQPVMCHAEPLEARLILWDNGNTRRTTANGGLVRQVKTYSITPALADSPLIFSCKASSF